MAPMQFFSCAGACVTRLSPRRVDDWHHHGEHTFDDARPSEDLVRARASRTTHSPCQVGIGEQSKKPIGEHVDVVHADGEPSLAVSDDLWNGARPRTNTWKAEVHRFHKCDSERLESGR